MESMNSNLNQKIKLWKIGILLKIKQSVQHALKISKYPYFLRVYNKLLDVLQCLHCG